MTEKESREEQEPKETPEVSGDADENPTEGKPTEGKPTEQQEHDRLKETTEKIWGSTKSAWNTATFKATQYKRLVQKKIDLSALHKKIGVAHSDLGKLVDDLRESGSDRIVNEPEVKELFKNIDSLKAAAAALEEEIENIREQAPDQEDPDAGNAR